MSNKQTTAMQEVQQKLIELPTDKFIEWMGRNQHRLLTKEREQINDAVSNALKLMCPTKDNLPNI